MGEFDDLIPKKPAQVGSEFDDLIPKGPQRMVSDDSSSVLSKVAAQPQTWDFKTAAAMDAHQHVRLLGEWIARYPPADDNWDYDPDPPAMPE